MGNIKNRLRFFKEKNMAGLVLLGILMMTVAIIIFGCLILKLMPENRNLSLVETLWESMKLILDPGGFLGNKLSAITTIVTSFIFIMGMIIFTNGSVGYVSNLISTLIENSKNGVGGLNISDYTLILNWNDKAMAIILDRLADKKRDNKNDYIIVLAEKDKIELEKYIDTQIRNYKYNHPEYNKYAPKVIVRNSNPQFPSELEKINYEQARIVFIMQPEGSEDPDYDVMKTYFSLAERNNFVAHASGDSDEDLEIEYADRVRVVVETTDYQISNAINEMPLRALGLKEYVTSTLANDFALGKIYAQIALMPELGNVYKEVMSLAGAVICRYDLNENSLDFEEEMKTLRYAIPIFSTTYEDGTKDRVYLVSETTSEQEEFSYLEKEEISISGEIDKLHPELAFDTHTIIICGFNNKLGYILNSIVSNNKAYPDRKSKVKFVIDKENLNELNELISNKKYKSIVCGEPTVISRYFNTEAIIGLIDEDFHSMLVLSNKSDVSADKNVFETWMGISSVLTEDEELAEQINGKIILEVTSFDNAGLLESDDNNQMVISNQFVSLFMAQMSEGETLRDILFDLLSTDFDEDFHNHGIESEDFCDLLAVNVGDFFNTDDYVLFESKQDCVWSVFKGTDKKYIPIGYSTAGEAYLFTNGKDVDKEILDGCNPPDMSDNVLVCGLDCGIYLGDEENEKNIEKLVLDPDDSIIVIKRAV